MSKTSTLVLITFNSPNSTESESAFLRVELEYLTRRFNRIIVVPQTLEGNIPTPGRYPYEVSNSLSTTLVNIKTHENTYLSAIQSVVFWKELFKSRKNLSIEKIKAILWFHGNGVRICKWVFSFCKAKNIDLTSSVFYTYWLDYVTYGLALAKRSYPVMKLISRAHGIDLYEERQPLNFFPFRKFTLQHLNELHLISSNGLKYISEKYSYKEKYKLSILGVRGPEEMSKSSPHGKIRIVSCAYIRPVKRINLMAEGIRIFALNNPTLQIFWNHFGGGDKLEIKATSNITVKFWGNVPNDIIIDFYKTNPVDVFLNTSSSEGIPVSIMEAIASGVPVIAPAVGGIPEIINSQNGILLDINPSREEIARSLMHFVPSSKTISQMRIASRRMWQEHFDADRNFEQFSEEVANLLEERK